MLNVPPSVVVVVPPATFPSGAFVPGRPNFKNNRPTERKNDGGELAGLEAECKQSALLTTCIP